MSTTDNSKQEQPKRLEQIYVVETLLDQISSRMLKSPTSGLIEYPELPQAIQFVQAHALLAIAQQLRTANRIAVYRERFKDEGEETGVVEEISEIALNLALDDLGITSEALGLDDIEDEE